MAGMATNTRLGTYVSRSTAGEAFKSYVPAALPPQPPLDMQRLYKPLDQAMKALGGIDALARLLPDISLFLYIFINDAVIFGVIELFFFGNFNIKIGVVQIWI